MKEIAALLFLILPSFLFGQMNDKAASAIKRSTLLKEQLTEEEFETIYPYDFKFVSKAEIGKAVLENDESKAYFSIVEEKVGVDVQYICNAGDGKVYTHKHSGFQTMSAMANKAFNRMISISDLKELPGRIK